MASDSPTELFKRAEEAIQRSRELCAATRRMSKEVRNEIAKVQETDRELETALYLTREARAAAVLSRIGFTWQRIMRSRALPRPPGVPSAPPRRRLG